MNKESNYNQDYKLKLKNIKKNIKYKKYKYEYVRN